VLTVIGKRYPRELIRVKQENNTEGPEAREMLAIYSLEMMIGGATLGGPALDRLP
jgi:hypothetical protein